MKCLIALTAMFLAGPVWSATGSPVSLASKPPPNPTAPRETPPADAAAASTLIYDETRNDGYREQWTFEPLEAADLYFVRGQGPRLDFHGVAVMDCANPDMIDWKAASNFGRGSEDPNDLANSLMPYGAGARMFNDVCESKFRD